MSIKVLHCANRIRPFDGQNWFRTQSACDMVLDHSHDINLTEKVMVKAKVTASVNMPLDCRKNLALKHLRILMARLNWCENESDIVSGWIHRDFNLVFTLSSDKDQREQESIPVGCVPTAH